MISVFILEDNLHKLEHITNILKNRFKDNIIIDSCRYFNEGLSIIINSDLDYVILDNNVFRFRDSYESVPNCAENVLSCLELRGDNTKCIICSSDDVTLEENYDNLLGIVRYRSNSNDWANKLINLMK